MQKGRDHQEREQKFGTRIAQQDARDARGDEPVEELDRRAR